MKKGIIAILVIVALYEISFRACTSRWGEINTDTRPVTLYYALDLVLPSRPLIHLFNWRANLPLGKIRLESGTGAYIDGGVFYRKNKNGNWENVTDAFEQYFFKKEAQQSVPECLLRGK